MSDNKNKWVTIAQVDATNNDDSSDSDGFSDFISFLSTPVGTIPPPPSPTKSSSITNTKVDNVDSTVDNSSDEIPSSNSNNNKAKPVLLSLPSYYVDSFHEHFFPHADDEDNDELVVRKKLSIPQRYVILYYMLLCMFFVSYQPYILRCRVPPHTMLCCAEVCDAGLY